MPPCWSIAGRRIDTSTSKEAYDDIRKLSHDLEIINLLLISRQLCCTHVNIQTRSLLRDTSAESSHAHVP